MSSALVLGLAVSLATPSLAQSTVIVGGTGKSSVEVNLDILEPTQEGVTRFGRVLKMPGMKPGGEIKLRMPGTSQSSTRQSSTSGKGTSQRLTLKPPSRLKINKQAPALPPARVTIVPAAKMPVTPPSEKAVPVARSAPAKKPAAKSTRNSAPAKAPMPISRPVQKPAPVAPPPPPPAPKMAAPAQTAPQVAPKVAQPAPATISAPPPPAAPKVVQPAPRKQKKVASLPPAINVTTPGLAMRVAFSGNSTRISAAEKTRLDGLAGKISGSGDRLQLKSFAGGSGETASASRRRSLSRALAVRSYLIEKGIRSTRIDVRALGTAGDSGPSDRVDVIILVR